jgi:hypothetical protein
MERNGDGQWDIYLNCNYRKDCKLEGRETTFISKIWSGLSESNRHLNLGKVPYYHYTKAALPNYL